jgi:uncharacterized protein (DUF362 family)
MNNREPLRTPAITRRAAMQSTGAAVLGVAAWAAVRALQWRPEPVFVAKNQRYEGALSTTIRDGLVACGFKPADFRGRRVLLKPNLVEPSRRIPHMTTHPAIIVAAAEVFRTWGASVRVGEAPGHVRDTLMALAESGVGEALDDGGLEFADLNYESVAWRRNTGRFSPLKGLYLPQSVLGADFVVSMPKMKTHHHVGMTASMKNFYGVLPGIKYGWPKNVLHHNGIPETVVDINCVLPRTLAIVDGIDCMEGDGPILGSRKSMGLVVVGPNVAAVDATVARIMGLEPERISYMKLASRAVGPIDDRSIEQRGEPWRRVASPFNILDRPYLQSLRSDHVALAT